MQRSSYAPPPAHSPPLHHPVPQHVSTVPMMRSPPPPQSQGSNYGSPYGGQMGQGQQGAVGGGPFAPSFGGFMNDQTAQMGFQVGKTALNAGQEYMEQNVCTIDCASPSISRKTNIRIDKPLRLRRRSKTLLQRHHPLRPP